jgi:FkbM family methyltransferase
MKLDLDETATNLKRRIKVLSLFLLHKNEYPWIEVGDLMYYLLYPLVFMSRVKNRITRMKRNRDYVEIKFKNIETHLFWPAECDLWDLYEVTAEIFDQRNWHYYETPETRVVRGDNVIDCGAAEGLFALSVKDRAKNVYIIEPLLTFVKSLEKTFAGDKNCHILPVAVGETRGKAFMDQRSKGSTISSSGSNEIDVETIDGLFFDQGIPVNYIKADLEGYELKMMKGARQSISKWKPRIAITAYHGHQDFSGLLHYIKKIVPEYKVRIRGMGETLSKPVMYHFWI